MRMRIITAGSQSLSNFSVLLILPHHVIFLPIYANPLPSYMNHTRKFVKNFFQ